MNLINDYINIHWFGFNQRFLYPYESEAVSYPTHCMNKTPHINSLVQYCSISSALALEILQSCTKPLVCYQSYGDNFYKNGKRDDNGQYDVNFLSD